MKKIFNFILIAAVSANISFYLVSHDVFYGDALRDGLSFTLCFIGIDSLIYSIKWKIEEIERKRNKKRDNDLIFLENEIRNDIESKKETA